jgi:hypothetical protein
MGATTLSIVTIRIMTESVMRLSIKTCSSVETKRRMTLNRKFRTMILSIRHSA